jgi:RNA polymerase sigma-70 factor, ECF subfamily
VTERNRDQVYDSLVRSHRAAFQRLARRLARDPEDAEDLLQETLVDAYRGFHRFRPETSFYNWLARIMTNNHLDRVRRKQHPVVSLDQAAREDVCEPLDLPDDSANPERVLLEEQLDHPYQSALEALQPLHRATVLLCDIEGATYEEAAEATSCPVGTIRSRLHRAHNAVRKFLSSFHPGESAAGDARLHSRRAFLQMSTAAAAGAAFAPLSAMETAAAPEVVRVLVWSDGPERSTGAIAATVEGERGVEVRTAAVGDGRQGLSDAALRSTDVLLWSGSGGQVDLRDDRLAAIVRRVRDEGMGLILTNSAGDSRILQSLLGPDCGWTGNLLKEGMPVDVRVTAPRHPIARGVSGFRIPEAKGREGDFAGPRPDVVVFDGAFGSSDRSTWLGMVWKIGKGRLFYFQPRYEGEAVYLQDEVRLILSNAVRWCAGAA